ncbi:MAG: hypothetical protein HON84_00835 [Candidatus Marinimicrobia bacterium]|nr:hypothetical protein [Candidatus Neomarinimicrobiota bacterium]MBT4808450.1 hypothetical protein [Candidatus Neomarinimicrobiota bacterium]MBT5176453.1 hypothetical protein [Candidatus Neomarinimicrobiota bacterium]
MHILLLFATGYLPAAFEHTFLSPLNVGLGFSYINFSNNILGTIMDPASFGQEDRFQLAGQTGRRFNLKPLTHNSFAGSIPTRWGHFGLGIQSFGMKQYSESTMSLIYGKRLKKRLKAGIAVNVYSLSIPDYGSTNTVGVSLAWQVQLNDRVHWGTILHNLNNPVIGDVKEPLPQLIITALSFTATKKISAQIEWEQDTTYEGQLKAGFKFQPIEWLLIHTGFVSGTGQVTGAIGLNFYRIKLNYAMANHPNLGPSHWMGFHIPLGR